MKLTPKQIAADIAAGYISAVIQGDTSDLADVKPQQREAVRQALTQIYQNINKEAAMQQTDTEQKENRIPDAGKWNQPVQALHFYVWLQDQDSPEGNTHTAILNYLNTHDFTVNFKQGDYDLLAIAHKHFFYMFLNKAKA